MVQTTVLIPAHDEQDTIRAAIAGLRAQTHPPARIIVVADNCTDSTITVADADVYKTVNNAGRKAGALNQALAEYLPSMDPDDHLLIQDADTVLSPTFVHTASKTLSRHRVGAVGGIFLGEPGHGLLGQLQRNEYERYARSIYRKGGKATVLTGTGTMFKVKVLREIVEARQDGRLPGIGSEVMPPSVGVYNPASLTEDD